MNVSAIALAAAVLLAVAVIAYGLAVAWREVMHDDAPLPFFGMLRRRGSTPDRLAGAVGVESLALAVRRCTFCKGKQDCRELLASGGRAPGPEFCPNAHLFARVGPSGR